MLCDKCKKNEATIHIKEFLNNQCKTKHLCPECAVKEGHGGELNPSGLNMADLIYNINKLAESFAAEKANQSAPAVSEAANKDDGTGLECPVCSFTSSDIRKSGGQLGCPECYVTFKEILQNALPNIQQGPVHLGKRPQHESNNREALRFELEKLKKELAKLVAREEYEAAAVCRDRINALKNNLEQL